MIDPRKLPPLRLHRGHTVHARYAPMERRFRYAITMVDVDIDRLDEASEQCRRFAVDRPALFSLRTRDLGARDGTSLRDWAEQRFSEADIELSGGVIRLVTFARHLGYRFAPISLWFGFDTGGKLTGIIYDVSNTFGENHAYVARVGSPDRDVHEAEKSFHVSPFMDVTGRYRFTLRAPSEGLSVVVENVVDGEVVHMANIRAKAVPATNGAFLRTALLKPFSSLGVTLGIHFQALFIWMRGAGYRRKPAPPVTPSTIARSVDKTDTTMRRVA